MEEKKEEQIIHPKGEVEKGAGTQLSEPVMVDTYGGRIEVEWDPEAPVTPFEHPVCPQIHHFQIFQRAALPDGPFRLPSRFQPCHGLRRQGSFLS